MFDFYEFQDNFSYLVTNYICLNITKKPLHLKLLDSK